MINMLAPEFRLNPYPTYKALRAHQPVLHIERLHIWSVFRYDDVRAVLSDHARFSSRYGDPDGGNLITSDPPRHTQLRSLVNRAFTPKSVHALEPRIEEITNELLDSVARRGELDLVHDLSYPLPVIVIAEMLGIPAKDRDKFKHWSDRVVESADTIVGGSGPGSASSHEEMNAYFREIIARRRVEPSSDLISALLAAQDGDDRLSERDILDLCWLLLVAGNETTTNLITNTIRMLLEHKDAMEAVQADPAIIPSAIEETLRYRSPVQAMFRITAQDVEMEGVKIPKGSRMVAWIGSANRDERKFADAETFDITRSPNAHIAFGHGIHFCLGAPLARLEARVAIETLLRRFPDLRRRGNEPLTPTSGFIVHGVTQLPLQFTPR